MKFQPEFKDTNSAKLVTTVFAEPIMENGFMSTFEYSPKTDTKLRLQFKYSYGVAREENRFVNRIEIYIALKILCTRHAERVSCTLA